MRVSLLIEGQEGVTWDDWVRIATLSEAHGLAGLYRSDHYASIFRRRAAALDAWTTLAGLAAITSRIRLGTLVSPVTFRHPSVLARTAVTVDHISRGRVDVGLGLGWYEREHTENGFAFGTTRERFRLLSEQVPVIVRSWTETGFDHKGDVYVLREQCALPLPYQRPHPPLILGGRVGPRFAALSARYASEVNALRQSVEEMHRGRDLLDRACSEIGRDPRSLASSILITCFLGETRNEASDRAREYTDYGSDDTAFVQMVESTRNSWLIGSVDEVAHHVKGYQRIVSHLVVRHLNQTDDDMVRLVGSELAPQLAR